MVGINLDVKNPGELIARVPYKRMLAFLSICDFALVFAPEAWLSRIFLLEFRDRYATVFGIAFIICLALWGIILFSVICDKIKIYRGTCDKACKQRFELLSEEALQVVLCMYENERYATVMELGSATANVLEAMQFVGRGIVSSHHCYFDYYLQPWVIKYLSKHISDYR